ncbi:MAG: type I-U CRISPR-associated protein Cas7 [Candidatus Binataceae bacterium]|nr:type I-U CRISPR-associated protein Cas7 [Candidatus Binataceae bacterium]
MVMTLEKLHSAVANAAAIRRVRRLQPAGGTGDKIFPPTYPGDRGGRNAGPRHVFERRRFGGENVLCVLIDSVQSQANRLEEALKAARETGALNFPMITVDFSNTEVADLGRITTLDAPHRVFDAIIRDSELNGIRFRETEQGRRLTEAQSHNARVVYELSPTALLFGAWNSTSEGGGLGAKFPRCVVSEIIGVGVASEPHVDPRTGEVVDQPSGKRTGSRIDPLGIRSGITVYKFPNGDWSLEVPKEKKGKDAPKEVRPSEINHSNIAPTVTSLGVSVDYALYSFVLSFAALRRLRFAGGSVAAAADLAAQTALAALGLAAVTAQDRNGYFLRSRCDLVPEENSAPGFELIEANGSIEMVDLDFGQATRLAEEAVEAARVTGVGWSENDLVLRPQAKLVQLVRASRELALQGKVEEEAEAEATKE